MGWRSCRIGSPIPSWTRSIEPVSGPCSARGRPDPCSEPSLAVAAVVAVRRIGGASLHDPARTSPRIGGPSRQPVRASRGRRASTPSATPTRRGVTVAGRPEPRADVDQGRPRWALDTASRLAWRSLRAGRRGLRRGQHIHRRRRAGRRTWDPDPGYVELLRGHVRELAGATSSGGGTPRMGRTITNKPPSRRETSCGSSVHPLRPRRRRPSRAVSSRSASGPPGSWPRSIPTSTGRLDRLQAG